MRKGSHHLGRPFSYLTIASPLLFGTPFAPLWGMPQTPYDLLVRTREFSLAIIRLYASLPHTVEAQIIGKQLLRAATSTGAHLREARFSRSDAEMLSKIEVGLQELEESRYWLELLVGSQILNADATHILEKETGELIAILVSSARRIKARKKSA
jgi:four helix bundle protein